MTLYWVRVYRQDESKSIAERCGIGPGGGSTTPVPSSESTGVVGEGHFVMSMKIGDPQMFDSTTLLLLRLAWMTLLPPE